MAGQNQVSVQTNLTRTEAKSTIRNSGEVKKKTEGERKEEGTWVNTWTNTHTWKVNKTQVSLIKVGTDSHHGGKGRESESVKRDVGGKEDYKIKEEIQTRHNKCNVVRVYQQRQQSEFEVKTWVKIKPTDPRKENVKKSNI